MNLKNQSVDEVAPQGQKKERQSSSKLLLLCFIGAEGRLQTPRSSTKYEITSKSLTSAAQVWQEHLLSTDAAMCPLFNAAVQRLSLREGLINETGLSDWLKSSSKWDKPSDLFQLPRLFPSTDQQSIVTLKIKVRKYQNEPDNKFNRERGRERSSR